MQGYVKVKAYKEFAAQARFIELLERHRMVGARLLAVARAWRATPGNA